MGKVIVKERGIKQLGQGQVNYENKTIKINGREYTMDEVSFDIPISGTVYGTLLNYKGVYEVFESSMNKKPYISPPNAPILYIKPENTFISCDKSIPLPNGVSALEVGASLGVVIGKTATNVSEEEALTYVSGYTIANDVSIPHKSLHRPAVKEKARDGFCPIGPWIVEQDSVKDPNSLKITVLINGEVKQENNTKNLIRSVQKLIADVTEFMTLYEGDTLLVGVPENAPLVKENDCVSIEIEGVGTLVNNVKAENAMMRRKPNETCTYSL